jgi:hypothetical protein
MRQLLRTFLMTGGGFDSPLMYQQCQHENDCVVGVRFFPQFAMHAQSQSGWKWRKAFLVASFTPTHQSKKSTTLPVFLRLLDSPTCWPRYNYNVAPYDFVPCEIAEAIRRARMRWDIFATRPPVALSVPHYNEFVPQIAGSTNRCRGYVPRFSRILHLRCAQGLARRLAARSG